MSRVELRDGMWAELRERINHREDKIIKVAVRKGRQSEELAVESDDVILRAFLVDWYVLDEAHSEKHPIPVTDPDALDRAPDDIVDELQRAAADKWVGATVPNAQYARLIGRLVMGQRVFDHEVDALPDPETFRDAIILSTAGTWTPEALDGADALLLELIRLIRQSGRRT